MAWRPLSKRGQSDPSFDQPVEGLPPYLAQPVVRWTGHSLVVDDYVTGERTSDLEVLQSIQLALRLESPLATGPGVKTAADLLDRMNRDETLALDVVDYILGHHIPPQYASYPEKLNVILRSGGSVWEVTPRDNGDGWQLTRRSVGPVREAIQETPSSDRAHQHLVTAWNRLSRRDPDPSGAYREAIRAVEAAAKPVVLPDNDRATLGTMITAMRDAPQKWTVTLGTVDDVRRTMEQVWTNQVDRHGTDDDSVPLNVSHEEADVAVHLGIALTRLFAGGHVRRIEG